MNLFKRILAFSLILLMAAPCISLSYLESRQFLRQLQMQEELEHAQLSTIITARLNWVEKGKEISIDGKIFDVKSVVLSNGMYIVTGLFDDEEKQIRDEISDIEGQDQDADAKILIAKEFSLYSFINSSYQFTPPLHEVLAAPSYVADKYDSHSPAVVLQPPRV